MQPKKIFKSMSPYKPGKQVKEVQREFNLEKIVKLASNENPFGYSEKVNQVIQDKANEFQIYPDGYATEIRQVLSEGIGVNPDQLVFGCGADEVIAIICHTYLDADSNTITATPTFPQYKHNALIQGAEVKEVPLLNGYHDLQGMLDSIDEKTKVIWLCSPNNPTGAIINDQSLNLFLEQCPKDILVVIDEAYVEYSQSKDQPNTVDLLHRYSNLVLLRTFSKIYGLAGFRIGYGIANLEVSEALNIARAPFNTTNLAQHAAIVSYQDRAFVNESIKKTNENKKMFVEDLEALDLEVYDSEANFVFVKLPVSGDSITEYLLKNGFIVRSGEALGHPNGVRITIGQKEDMKVLQGIIKSFLDEYVGVE